MSALPDPAEILTEEQRAMRLLAYYDARSVAESDLRKVFNCTSAALEEVRKEDFYLAALAAEKQAALDVATTLDDQWDNLETRALGELSDLVAATADPRMLLGMAVQANKAARRAGATQPRHASAARHGNTTIDVDALTDSTRVVRLRTRFLERLSQDGSVERMLEREAELRTSTASMQEDLSPSEVKALLRASLGVDTDNLRVKRHGGADALPGVEIDFGQL